MNITGDERIVWRNRCAEASDVDDHNWEAWHAELGVDAVRDIPRMLDDLEEVDCGRPDLTVEYNQLRSENDALKKHIYVLEEGLVIARKVAASAHSIAELAWGGEIPSPLPGHRQQTEEEFEAEMERMNCPLCGGSGHVDDADTAIVKKIKSLEHRVAGYGKECNEVEQILGKVLGYPKYPDNWNAGDDVCTGEHSPAVLAAEAAEEIVNQRERLSGLEMYEQRAPIDVRKQDKEDTEVWTSDGKEPTCDNCRNLEPGKDDDCWKCDQSTVPPSEWVDIKDVPEEPPHV